MLTPLAIESVSLDNTRGLLRAEIRHEGLYIERLRAFAIEKMGETTGTVSMLAVRIEPTPRILNSGPVLACPKTKLTHRLKQRTAKLS